MGYTNFENEVTPLSDTVLNLMQTKLMMLVFPIGSIYVTQDAETNPNSILEFGTWERLKGIIPIGLDEDNENFSQIGKTGGNQEISLESSNLPESTPTLSIAEGYLIDSGNSTAGAGQVGIKNRGGTVKKINILPPYEVTGVYWIRRA